MPRRFAPRNDMQKLAGCLRVQERAAMANLQLFRICPKYCFSFCPTARRTDCHVASLLAMTCRRWAGVRGCKDAMTCKNLPGACVCKDAMPCKTLPGICICLGALPGQSRPGIYPPAALGIQGNCIRFPEKKQFLFRQKNQIFLAVPGDILNFYRLNYGLRQTVGEFSYHENGIFIHQYSF